MVTGVQTCAFRSSSVMKPPANIAKGAFDGSPYRTDCFVSLLLFLGQCPVALCLVHDAVLKVMDLTEDFTAEKFTLKIDEFHLSNALINLLDNANKYSPEKPEINIKTRNEGNKYVIEISDKGMRMEAFNKKKIFEKFFREETGNVHNVKGQGLGLSYVKRIIELHGGQILVESTKGQGSTFTVKLPMS